MAEINASVIYYSSTGTNYQMAQIAADALQEEGAKVRLAKVAELAPMTAIEMNPAWKAHHEATHSVPEATLADLETADLLIFSVPTRFGNVASQMKQFLDQAGPLWATGKLTDKVVTAMTSASTVHGGQEATLLALNVTFMHWGMILVPPGYTDPIITEAGGNPYGTSVLADGNELAHATRQAIRHQALRALAVTKAVVNAREVA